MTSIRAQLENHQAIIVVRSATRGNVLVERADLNELEAITQLGPLKVYRDTETHFEVSLEDFQALVKAAHDRLHGILDNEDDEKGSPEAQPEEDDEQLRNLSMHYAAQVLVARIHAANGLEAVSFEDHHIVSQAKAILDFLKG